MRDEEYVYYQDVREKKVTGYSARKRRSHCGKGGRVKFPSDYLTKKELMKMNGKVKSYRLNDPMKWAEFLAMPDEHKITYIKLLRQKYNVPGKDIAQMMGTNPTYYSKEIGRLGISQGKNCRGGYTQWDKEGFLAWAYGVPAAETAEEVKEERSADYVEYTHYDPVAEEEAKQSEEVIVEETPVTEEVPFVEIPNPGIKVNLINAAEESTPAFAIPTTGSMTYEGDALDILRSISRLLGGAKVLLSVKWDVVED